MYKACWDFRGLRHSHLCTFCLWLRSGLSRVVDSYSFRNFCWQFKSVHCHRAEDVKQNLIFPCLIVLHLYLPQYVILGYGIMLELFSQENCKNVHGCTERCLCLNVMFLPRTIWFILSSNYFPNLCLVFWFCNVKEHLLLIRKEKPLMSLLKKSS